MNQKQKGIALILAILVLIGGISYFLFNQNNQEISVEYLQFKEVKAVDAKQALLNGEIDIYTGSLPAEDVKELENNPKITLYPATSSVMGLYFNPYPSEEKLNPFSIKKVRYAMQFLVNREELANNLFGGFATPTQTVPWSSHPDYATIQSVVEGLGIGYNKEEAQSLITEGMSEAGAVLEENGWMYQGEPVNIIISHYDSPKSSGIASYLKASLEEVGFMVTLVGTDGDDPNAEAPDDYTNAADLKWNISISGWAYYSQSKISNAAILEPYVASSDWWEYTNEEIDALEEELSNVKTEEERMEIDAELAKKYLEDATCVWLVTVENVSAVRSEVKGLVQDEFLGISNITNIREAYIPNKDTLVVGLPSLYKKGGGLNHLVVNGIDMMYLLNTIHDPLKWDETNTLNILGFRWPFIIEGEDSNSVIDVPEDSFVWDVDYSKWAFVGEDKKAVTKVTYDLSNYLGTSWHNGQEIVLADVVFNIARDWDAAFNESKLEIDNNWHQILFKSIVGIRISGQALEVYLDKWSPDKNDLLVVARIFQRAAPWELYVATDDLVFNQRLYDYQFLEGSENEKLDVADEEHIAAIFTTLESFDFEKVKSMMTIGDNVYAEENDLVLRLEALKEWNNFHNHLYINDGPFYVDSFNSDGSIDLKAFNNINYPFAKGHWRE